jgi:hypothetical protein
MKRFWRQRRPIEDLGEELRAARPEPSPALVHALVERIEGRIEGKERHGSSFLRFALAGSVTVVMLVALAATGALSYAASGAVDAVSAMTKAVDRSGPTTVSSSPSSDQYRPGKGCGDKNHIHDRKYQCKISVNDVSHNEGNSGTTPFVFTVSLSDTPIDAVTVVYTTANGTATAGTDYLPVAGTTLTFPVGVMTQTVTVPVIGDTLREANETFYVNLTNPSDNALIADPQGLGTIVNDDR